MTPPAAAPAAGPLAVLRRRGATPLLLLAVSFGVYAPILRSYFVSDDFEVILQASGRSVPSGSFDHAGGILRPLLMLSLRIDFELFGLSPVGYHVVNVAMHALAAWLVTLLARRLLGEVAGAAPLAAGLVFALLPSHSEAVSWIVGRGDLLMTVAALAALLGWLTLDGWRRHALVVPAVAAALLTKESAIALPFVLLAAELLFVSAKRVASAVRVLLPELAVLAGFFLLRLIVRGDVTGGFVGEYRRLGPVRAVGKAAVASLRSLLPGLGDGAGAVLGIAVIVAVVLAVAFAGVERTTWLTLAFLAAGVVLTVAPIVPLGVSLSDTAGERLVYLPSAFAVVALVTVLRPAFARLATPRWSGPRWGVLAAGGAMSLVVLVGLGLRWADAGNASRRFIDTASAWPRDRRVVVLDSPDNLGGAYVARNSLGAAMVLVHGWSAPEQISELSSVELSSVDDRASAVAGPCARCLDLRLGAGMSFVEVATRGSSWELADVGVARLGERRVRVTLPPGIDREAVWYFSEGRLRRVG